MESKQNLAKQLFHRESACRLSIVYCAGLLAVGGRNKDDAVCLQSVAGLEPSQVGAHNVFSH